MKHERSSLCLSSEGYFKEEVEVASRKLRLDTLPQTKAYLVDLLRHYMNASNLFDEESLSGKKQRSTLAALYLKAFNETEAVKYHTLKKLGDTSLYISGFFAESLSRKFVDVNYYVDMGGAAYTVLAKDTKKDTSRKIFNELSSKFVQFVDILSWISKKSAIQTESNLIQIYESYLKTRSQVARDILVSKGILVTPLSESKN